MTRDPRLTPANERVAAADLRGKVVAPVYATGEAHQLHIPIADLLDAPGGARVRQVLMGERMTVYEFHDGRAFVQMESDGYVGYLPEAALGPVTEATHRVSARATHAYEAPDFKSPELLSLSHGALLTVMRTTDGYAETAAGFFPAVHLGLIETRATDPATVAEGFLGAPYLWGGNSSFGIDCSGLVQAALRDCGIRCPRDSDMQEAALGEALPPDATLQRGDLLFWRGHVAMMLDAERVIHANAFHMAVAIELLEPALTRIAAAYGGPITSRRRFPDLT